MVSGGIMGNVCGVNDRAMYVIVNEQGFASYFYVTSVYSSV